MFFFCRAATQQVCPHSVLLLEVIYAQVQDLAFLFVELCEVPANSFLQPSEVSLNGSPVLQHVKCSLQFGVICKLAIPLHHVGY